MARMIPSYVDEHAPPGERDVFALLAGGPDDWVVMHSLDLAPWNQHRRTEIDFVLIIPDTGILCVEVKSHRNIAFDGQRWFPEEIHRSPFKQAMDGKFAFYRRLRGIAPEFRRIPVAHCCFFPRARFDIPPNMSVASWELLDARTFGAIHTSEELCLLIKAGLLKGIEADTNVQKLEIPLSQDEVANLVKTCMPVQKRIADPRDEISRKEEQLAGILREQQKPVLRLADCNEHIVVSGAAGTGKTLIAMALAREMANRGKRVALLCFNQLIGDWMQREMTRLAPVPPNLVVGRAIRVMAEITSVVIPDFPRENYWEVELPELLKERLDDADLREVAAFDYLVLDEAQDILARPRLWQCLTRFLRDESDCGAFALFGDFDYQVLGARQEMRNTMAGIEKTFHPVRWRLTENCRNYKIVAKTALGLSDLPSSVYSSYLRTGGGHHNYDISFYKNSGQQVQVLAEWIREFIKHGYKPGEISILSFLSGDKCIALELKDLGIEVRPAWCTGECVGYTSIHAFNQRNGK